MPSGAVVILGHRRFGVILALDIAVVRKRFPLFATVVVAPIVPIFVVNTVNPFCVIFAFFRVSVTNVVAGF
jgi:hypothetical protein